MSSYNPDVPFVLGNEFAGIVNSPMTFQVGADAVEYGYGLTTTATRNMQDARVYAQVPGYNGDSTPAAMCVNVYPAGLEDASGPVRSLVIPANTGFAVAPTATDMAITANGVVTQPAASAGAATVNLGTAVQGFGNSKISYSETGDNAYACFYFNVAEYIPALTGKRIIGLNVLYRLVGNDAQAATDNSQMTYGWIHGSSGAFGLVQQGSVASDAVGGPATIRRLTLGPSYNLLAAGFQNQLMTPTTLQFLQSSTTAGNRLGIFLQRFGNPGTIPSFTYNYVLTYVALEVLYCEEQRVMVAFGTPVEPVTGLASFPYGAWVLPFKDLAGNASPSLPAGSYTVTAQLTELMDFAESVYPPFNQLLTAYTLPGLQGLTLVKPFPLYNNVGSTFTETNTDLLPQISLHTSSGPIPECQVYGVAQGAPVYSGQNAVQSIDDSPVIANTHFNQVRYYARYFGSPEASLVCAAGTPSSTLTKVAHDALPVLVNGWKEVTLPLSSAAILGGVGTTSTWTFSSSATVGNRWEVLCVTAPALTGTSGDNLKTVTAAQVLDASTYLAPAGATADLTWITPTASGSAADTTTDAVLMLAQNPPTLTLTLTAQSQALTGVGTLCGVVQPYMPTTVTYQRLTWVSPALTGSGFGYYELQRLDTVDNTWNTVMLAYAQTTVQFNDFEARVNVQSSYRIRVASLMGFLGAWSATVNGTVAAPGVTGGTNAGQSVLLFTSNGSQSGRYTLAYPETTDATTEPLTFPEVGRRQLQWTYGKDFMTAFSPTERGGEQFTRVLLVQNAAIAGPVIQQGFQSLRDLGWATLPYVCVRNELGDRWLADVQVPSAVLQRNRQIQLATVQVTETSTVPAAVDPATAV